jgi:hypothetical protein
MSTKDHDNIPEHKRVASSAAGLGKKGARRLEAAYAEHVEQRRAQLSDGGNTGSIRHDMSIPAELYHGKIKETGDKAYWKDKRNVARHKAWKVSK